MDQHLVANTKSIFYPPGGLLIWIVIFLELLTFAAALIVMVSFGKDETEAFANSSAHLNKIIGSVNTVVLITSGFFMALATLELQNDNKTKCINYLNLAILGGFLFVIIKGFEYYSKLEAGLTISYDTFFSFYWMLTFFHLVHVIVGLVILIAFHFKLKKASLKLEDFEAGASFWHMCDLIWLLLFPVIYLFF